MANISQAYRLEKQEQLRKSAVKAPGGGTDQPHTTVDKALGALKHVADPVTHPVHLIDRPYVPRKYSINSSADGRAATTADDGPIIGMMVPWNENMTWGISLTHRETFDFCFTDAMNGCCVVVQGSGTSRPMFFHANLGFDPVFSDPSQFAAAHKKAHESRADGYAKLLPKLLEMLPPVERGDAIQTAFGPDYYMDPERFPGFKGASVFGFKHGDNWLFFYHVFMERPAKPKLPKEAVAVSDTIYSATGECWPNFQMLTW
jgi:hypothetical protein